ncbi:MAG: hypothetical protein KF724_08765 [Phycisphaeraceae bacterium]|nr:hypothetical protein [Phycisphaeraceae bacterium]
MSTAELWVTAIGRLHPAVLHFPLALGVFAAMVECWGWLRRRSAPTPTGFTLLWAAAVFAIPAAMSGLLLAEAHDDDSTLMTLHRWSGIASVILLWVVAITAAVLRRRQKRSADGSTNARGSLIVRLAMIGVAALLAWCGHLGGEMKWGSGFTTETLFKAVRSTIFGQRSDHADGHSDEHSDRVRNERGEERRDEHRDEGPDERRSTAPSTRSSPEERGEAHESSESSNAGELTLPVAAGGSSETVEAILYEVHIRPLFTARCAECHMGGRRKGRLALGRVSDVIRQNSDGHWIVRVGEPEESELLRRLLLPAGDEFAMPPEGPRLTEDEVALVRQWIAQGAK